MLSYLCHCQPQGRAAPFQAHSHPCGAVTVAAQALAVSLCAPSKCWHVPSTPATAPAPNTALPISPSMGLLPKICSDCSNLRQQSLELLTWQSRVERCPAQLSTAEQGELLLRPGSQRLCPSEGWGWKRMQGTRHLCSLQDSWNRQADPVPGLGEGAKAKAEELMARPGSWAGVAQTCINVEPAASPGSATLTGHSAPGSRQCPMT